jgi:hypothetical protein
LSLSFEFRREFCWGRRSSGRGFFWSGHLFGLFCDFFYGFFCGLNWSRIRRLPFRRIGWIRGEAFGDGLKTNLVFTWSGV